jgi:hypothetical protein
MGPVFPVKPEVSSGPFQSELNARSPQPAHFDAWPAAQPEEPISLSEPSYFAMPVNKEKAGEAG